MNENGEKSVETKKTVLRDREREWNKKKKR